MIVDECELCGNVIVGKKSAHRYNGQWICSSCYDDLREAQRPRRKELKRRLRDG